MLALRLTSRSINTLRSLSTTSINLRQPSPSGATGDSFNKREKAAEEQFVRDNEREKLKALRKSIEASKSHLEQLEKDHAELEKNVQGGQK